MEQKDAALAFIQKPTTAEIRFAGARGVLVNVTASSGLRMKEYQDVMTTIKEFTADDALVIVGTVIDDAMDDQLRVTMIATGLGGAQAVRREQKAPSMTLVEQPQVIARTGTDGVGVTVDSINYEHLDAPAVMRKRERGIPTAPAFDATEIPAFLRKQAD